MSASKTSRFPSSSEARAAGWFSRRHQTSEAHEAAKARRLSRIAEQQADSDLRDIEARMRREEHAKHRRPEKSCRFCVLKYGGPL